MPSVSSFSGVYGITAHQQRMVRFITSSLLLNGALSSIRQLLVIIKTLSSAYAPLRVYGHDGHFVVHNLQLDSTIDCFSPLAPCILPLDTVRVSHQVGGFHIGCNPIHPYLVFQVCGTFSNRVLSLSPARQTRQWQQHILFGKSLRFL